MEQDIVERKLAAILYADVVDYSKLTGQDEVGTHQALIASLDVITDSIENHNGTVVNFAGDAALAEFASAVNAVECAVGIQRALNIQNKNTWLLAAKRSQCEDKRTACGTRRALIMIIQRSPSRHRQTLQISSTSPVPEIKCSMKPHSALALFEPAAALHLFAHYAVM